jgi:hypothetical protein
VICGSHTTSWTSSKTFTTLQSCNAPTVTQLSHTNVTAASATLNTSASGVFRKFRYRRQNTTTWFDSPTNLTNAWSISGLVTGTTYEYQASVKCSQNSSWSAYSGSKPFTTTQTCTTPALSLIGLSSVTATTATLFNNASGAAKSIRYRRTSTSTWTGFTITSGSTWNITGLTSGATYEYQGAVRCSNGLWSDYTSSKTFTTIHLSVTPTQHTFNISNNVARVINVTSNGSWTATSSTASHGQSSQLNWLRTFTANGSGGSMPSISGTSNGAFSIQVLTNQGTTRTGTISVTTAGITRIISVTQLGSNGRPAISNETQMEAELSFENLEDSTIVTENESFQWDNRSIEKRENTFKIAPNPTSGQFSIFLDIDPTESLILELFNSYGQLVNRLSQGNVIEYTNKLDFDLSMLPAGNYFIKGIIGNKMITEKLMIVK